MKNMRNIILLSVAVLLATGIFILNSLEKSNLSEAKAGLERINKMNQEMDRKMAEKNAKALDNATRGE